ncbi:hypothetical protein DSO57_1036978 [Entomophthora muscae]|uniref:Uncharacterized protein n=1 Tax=Entomophthora muscae TaxID=34485 RepID=A0ACC2SC13_9FUNG|nr:hypothetical protein DSO57_1036978 [Entomophthora muscae]
MFYQTLPLVSHDILNYGDEIVPVMVQLEPPTKVIETIHSATFSDPDSKALALVEALQTFSTKSQTNLVNYLERLKIQGYRSYYISNTIAIEASKSAILNISQFSGVKAIGSNFLPPKPTLHRRDPSSIEHDFPEYATDTFPDLSTPPLFYEPGIRQMEAHNIDERIIKAAGKLVLGNLDTGVDYKHPALRTNYMGSESNHSFTWFDAAQNSTYPNDMLAHGTSVVSLAVGRRPIGISPESKWIACRAFNNKLAITEMYLKCQQFLLAPTNPQGNHPNAKLRPHVIANSWACADIDNCFFEPFIYTSHAHYVAGIFNVAGAGNDGERGCQSIAYPPAENEHSFVVAALGDRTTKRAYYSSFGPSRLRKHAIDVAVVGDDVMSAGANSGYRFLSGTSVSAPLVAGAALLAMAACPHLQRNVDALTRVMQLSATPLYSEMGCGTDTNQTIPNNEFGYGLLNLQRAISICQSSSSLF